MNGYVKIKSSEIPFYISLAEDAIKFCDSHAKYWRDEISNIKPHKIKWNKPTTWFDDKHEYHCITRKYRHYESLSWDYFFAKEMFIKAKDRDIYIDVDSFDLLEKENK